MDTQQRVHELEKRMDNVSKPIGRLDSRIADLEAELEALRDMNLTLSRWNGVRVEEISKHKDSIDDLTKRLELLGETVNSHTDARLSGLEATTTIFDTWSSGVNDTLQKVMDRFDELEASRPAINTYSDQFERLPAHKLAQMRHYSRNMYTVLEMFEKAQTPQSTNEAYKAMNRVLRKIRQGKNNPSGNAHRGEAGSNE